ncbi:MAG: haloacid dehalogenase type II [Bauldia sp.]
MARPLTGVRACLFDAYGTLFDFASATRACRDVLGDDADRLAAVWRDKQIQYTWLRAAQDRHADFWRVTGDALDFSLEALRLDQPGLRDRLMNLYLTLAPFPEVAEVLRRLKDAGMKTAILSNGTPAMLNGAVSSAGIGGYLDFIFSVEEVGVFKPHPKVYRHAADRLGMAPAEIAFQSSNGWDVYAASAFGLRTVWCNRYRQPRERLPGAPDAEIATLTALLPLLGVG